MEKVINQVKSSWSKDLTIRFLYIKLAPFFRRDPVYFYKSEEEKYKEYKEGFINRFPDIVCSSLADYYVDLFHKFGINAKKIIANSAKIPLFALIVEGDKGWYYLDPLSDLVANQYGTRPYFFGVIPRYNTVRSKYKELIKLPREYVDELDNELEISYLDEFFKYLHTVLTQRRSAKEFFGYPPNEPIDLRETKLEFMNDNLINIGNVNGVFNRASLYLYLNDQILNKGEKRYVRTCIEGDVDNLYLSYSIKKKDETITYIEEKQNGIYRLTKLGK